MAVNVADVQNHQTLSIESVNPKLRPIRSHPYLNTYSTPPLPKPLHFHQFSDQTGQSNHKKQLSTISLPQQFSVKSSNNPFEQQSNFESLNQPIYSQIDKQSVFTNNSLEKYETQFSYSDLEKTNGQQVYINHPSINRIITSNGQINGLKDEKNRFIISQFDNKLNHSEKQLNKPNHGNSHFKHIGNNRSQEFNTSQSTYHGLPMKFVLQLKKLFDIFDSNKCGLIRISDIENRIRDEEFDEDLDRPQDLIESLRRVTSPNGLINFSNFCAAINICLLKNQLAKTKKNDIKLPVKIKSDRNDSYLRAQNLEKSFSFNLSNGHRVPNGNYQAQKYSQQSSLNSSPLENSSFTSTSSSNSSARLHKDFNKLSIKSNNQPINCKLKYRPSSVPVESFNNDEEIDYKSNIQSNLMNKKLDNKAKSMGNLKEQIYANRLRLCSSESRIQSNQISPQAIMEKLFEWRNNLLEKKLRMMNGTNLTSNNINYSQFNRPPAIQPQPNHLYSIVNKKTNPRKRNEERRHTVTSLHSLNTATKLMNMQKESELLQQGIHIIERAKQFYLRQIEIVKNQIDYLSQHTQNGTMDNFFINQLNSNYNIRQHQDKINTLDQINQNLILLLDNQLLANRLNSQSNPFIELHN